jgi:malonyl-CoA O-methyltransferase
MRFSMAGIDRRRVRESFDRHAFEYDRHSGVQRLVVERISELLEGLGLAPELVLDIGSGTGILLERLSELYPEARLVGLDLAHSMSLVARDRLQGKSSISIITADAESLPFQGLSFPLIVSTSTFQWLGELERVFSEAYRVLVPEGMFLFALFGEKTLYELRGSYKKAWEAKAEGPEERTLRFPLLSATGTALERSGFSGVRVFSEREVEYHRDVQSLLRSLKGIGASNTSQVRARGLAERGIMRTMMDIYTREYGKEGLIPATYEVIYGLAVKPTGVQNI